MNHQNKSVKKNRQSRAGFTLLEMLVVMVIIGILISIAASNFTSARIKARDGAKKSDLNQVAEALEMYYNDKDSYPAANVNGQIVDIDTGQVFDWGADDGFYDPNNTDTVYMNQLPTGAGGQNYFYEACETANCNAICTAASDVCDYYRLYALLENMNDSDIARNGDTPSYYVDTQCGADPCNYVVVSSNLPEPTPAP